MIQKHHAIERVYVSVSSIFDSTGYMQPTSITWTDGRSVPKAAHGTIHLDPPTNLGSRLIDAAVSLYAQITSPQLLVRRISIAANRVIEDHGIYQLNLFTDMKKLEREKKLQETMLDIKKRFGKNSVLKGTSFLDGATMRERNGQIGGHKA